MNTQIKNILCPVDLSKNSVAAIELASSLAKQHDASLSLLFVSSVRSPEKGVFASDFVRQHVEANKAEFMQLRPADSEIRFDHKYLYGNAGPEIVRESKSSDLIVMSTHGRSGIMRFLMGSVTQYVLRNSDCPVVLYANRGVKLPDNHWESNQQPFVTEVMRQVAAVREFDSMKSVLEVLKKEHETGAPVVDDSGNCIGILTMTDIQRYRDLKKRIEERDESVIEEAFEINTFGQRRADNVDFDQVKRHMTSPAITISVNETCEQAFSLFQENPGINHLVIIDDSSRPVGITGSEDLVGYEFSYE